MVLKTTTDRRLRAHYQAEVADRRERELHQQLRIFREGLMRRNYSVEEIDAWVKELEERLRGKGIT
jgi:hypothetical protein